INGSSDAVGGVICGTTDFINSLKDVNSGACMLLGPTMDSLRAASILKNLRTLHLRMKKHSKNAQYLAERWQEDGLKVKYPGLESHPQHSLFSEMMNAEFGYGGLIALDVETVEKANELMEAMQEANL